MAAGAPHPSAGSDWGKADFEAIYDCPDPRTYFRTLRPLDYQIPHHGQGVFRALAEHLQRRRPGRRPLQVVDLCCSYGVNAALLNHKLGLADLYDRYTDARETGGLSAARLAGEDRAFFDELRRPEAVRTIGIDAARRAVGYAERVGLLDAGFAENLEAAEPSARLRHALAGTDLITVTGGVGYISATTFGRLLACTPEPPWVAAFVLRTVSYAPIADLLARSGLVTERFPARTFRQRRFADLAERRAAFTALQSRDLDTTGKESDGFYHADLYLSRPAADAADVALERLVP